MLNIDEILKEKEVTTEKKVYGFVYILFLFAKLNDLKPYEVLNLIGDKIKLYISCGWGDLCQNRERTMSEWCKELLKEAGTYQVTEEMCNQVSFEARQACCRIIEQKRVQENLHYSEIIYEYFKKIK